MFASRLHDYFEPSDTAESRALLASIGASARAENQAAARRLSAVAELFELRRRERGERSDWAVDTWAAVGAEVAAALRVSLAMAGSYLNYGLEMKRLPAVAASSSPVTSTCRCSGPSSTAPVSSPMPRPWPTSIAGWPRRRLGGRR